MTNLERLKEVFSEVFGVEFSNYGPNIIYGCKLVNCPMPPYCESCANCDYKGFWEQEYVGNRDDVCEQKESE